MFHRLNPLKNLAKMKCYGLSLTGVNNELPEGLKENKHYYYYYYY
jgi:hypothetical protein